MDINFQIQNLSNLVEGDWEKRSISAHNRIINIRVLIGHLGSKFSCLDASAVEIETIIGTAMGMGDDYLSIDDVQALSIHLSEMKKILGQIKPA